MAVDPAGAAHVFVDDIDVPLLEPGDAHHLGRVLRLRAGERLTASDGRGRWRWCRWPHAGGTGPGGVLIDLDEDDHKVVAEACPSPTLTVAFAPVKGDRSEWVVQKLTELGVDRIIPLITDRSIVRWEGDRADRQRKRLASVARETAMQSRRAWLPEVAMPVTFAAACGFRGACLADPGGGPPDLAHPTVLIGPEGGWSPAERACGLRALGLGPTILRAETAALSVGVLLAALRSGLLHPGVLPAPDTAPDPENLTPPDSTRNSPACGSNARARESQTGG